MTARTPADLTMRELTTAHTITAVRIAQRCMVGEFPDLWLTDRFEALDKEIQARGSDAG